MLGSQKIDFEIRICKTVTFLSEQNEEIRGSTFTVTGGDGAEAKGGAWLRPRRTGHKQGWGPRCCVTQGEPPDAGLGISVRSG